MRHGARVCSSRSVWLFLRSAFVVGQVVVTTPREALMNMQLGETLTGDILTTLAPFLRTPGTVEVCENHVYKECRNQGGGMAFKKCRVKPCPLKPKETVK